MTQVPWGAPGGPRRVYVTLITSKQSKALGLAPQRPPKLGPGGHLQDMGEWERQRVLWALRPQSHLFVLFHFEAV